MKKQQVAELLYQALETELGGVQVYRAAVACAQNEELKQEWRKYGRETSEHVRILEGVFGSLGLDPQKQTVGRRLVREKGQNLVAAMEKALRDGSLASAQLVAAECVVDAETKDHQNWELIGEVAKKAPASAKKTLTDAYEQVEDQEDEHLYHTKGWARELWLDSLGLPAELPPPEEKRGVKTAIEEAQIAEERKGKETASRRGGTRSQNGGEKSRRRGAQV
ncbi:MAG: hypothetical protein M3167_05445 [Acidobacteriota bacterium]|nr:hypothetical protein [Acidobacteriota bacterium]